MNSGIYQIRNLVNNKIYIGSAVDLKHRKSTHFSNLRWDKNLPNPHVQSAYNKYGKDQFVFEVLEYCDPEYLLEREQWYLDNYQPEYNKRKIAESNLGIIRSEEFKQKHREYRPSEETKRRTSKSLMGSGHTKNRHPLSEEIKQKYRDMYSGNNSIRARSVVMIDPKTNEILKVFGSLSSAQKETGITYTNISAVCRGEYNLAGGYKWKYLDNE